jgi:hypothetical protein
MGMALATVDGLAIGIGHREARDGDCLAPKRIPTVPEVEFTICSGLYLVIGMTGFPPR